MCTGSRRYIACFTLVGGGWEPGQKKKDEVSCDKGHLRTDSVCGGFVGGVSGGFGSRPKKKKKKKKTAEKSL